MKIIGKMAIALLVVGFLGFSVTGLEAKTINVKCEKGESVQKELNKLDRPATLVVTGTCHEYLDITQDDVTIQGGNYEAPTPPDPTKNLIWVRGARRVLMTGVTVSGGYNAISAYQGASLTLENSTISGAANNGVVSVFGSAVTVNSSTIQGNLQGATAADNSAIVVINSHIQNNTGTGVLVIRSSSARIGQNLRGQQMKSWITGNAGNGVSVSRGSHAIIDGNDIIGNSSSGVGVEGSSATVINNIISGNGGKGIYVASSGNSRIGINDSDQPAGNTIENNGYDGIQISNSAAAYMLANTIRLNGLTTGRHGVGIHRASGRLMGNNIIQGNGWHGVSVNLGQLYQGVGDFFNLTPGPDQITGNEHSGIYGWNGAHLDIQHLTVTGNKQHGIALSLQSTLRLFDATISGNLMNGIVLWDSSSVARYSTDSPRDTITGNTGWGIICYGESHLVGGTGNSGVSGNSAGQVNCPGVYFP
jgi:parallel beta-helix repeat protein